MAKYESRSNYLITLAKFVFFLIFFCFMVKLTGNLLSDMQSIATLSLKVFYVSIFSALMFYLFIADLNTIYDHIQNFFFRHSFVNLILPSVLVLLALGYFIIPKIWSLSFDKDTFVFLGGFILMIHLIYIAQQTREGSFVGFVNYLFMFSTLYVVSIFLFAVYLRVAFPLNIGDLIVHSFNDSTRLVVDLYKQIVH
ncbi:MAG: hypothetical protein JXD21_03530 [Candidatus Omnitrophica bacterium]|nr:hypothetical protein [Candidatus Omnitrophota bacterium]